MGKWDSIKDKKYREILESREMVNDALDLDKRLKKLRGSLKKFEEDMDIEKGQSKIRDFRN